jgi:peptidoglycan pentaglycine glycine transferase (the first glycine)
MRNTYSEQLTVKEVSEENYNPLAISSQAAFPQAYFYGSWHEKMGRKVLRFSVEDKSGSEVIGFFQVIIFPMPFGKKVGYIPRGPVFKHNIEIKKALFEIAKKENLVFLRLEPEFNFKSLKAPTKSLKKLVFSQPTHEWVLDLSPTLPELIANMHKKTRYSVRVAESPESDLKVKIIENSFVDYLEVFLTMMQITAKRDGFSLHPESYYRNIFNSFEQEKNAFLVLVYHKENLLSVHANIIYGNTAYYLFGATSNEFRETMPSYKAHITTFEYLKSKSINFYNFGGIEVSKNSEDSLAGVTLYKTRFGGFLKSHEFVFDIVVNKLWYMLFSIYKKFK